MVTISGAILVSLSRLFHNSNNSESDNTLPACVPQFLEARGSQRGVSKTRGRGRGLFFFFFKEYCFSVDTNPNPETAFFKKRKTPTTHFTDTQVKAWHYFLCL